MMLLFLVSLAAAACSATELKVAPGYDILHTLDLQNVSRVRLQPGVHTVSRPWKLGGDIKNLLILGEGGATISGGLPVTRWSRAELGLASSPPMRFSAPYMDDDSINQKRPSTTRCYGELHCPWASKLVNSVIGCKCGAVRRG